MSINTPADQLPQVAFNPITLGWVLKRSAIGIAILTIAISAMAWLTYASIDQQLDAQTIEGEADTSSDLTKVNLRF
jgi:hypothetical protein